MVEIETITVRLGERDFEIKTAGFLRSKPWKKRLLAEVKPLFEQIGGIDAVKFDSPADLLSLIPVLEDVFVESIEKVLELLLAYSETLEAEQEYIKKYATDKQILFAFQGAVKLADPFGVVQLMTRRIGLTATGT